LDGVFAETEWLISDVVAAWAAKDPDRTAVRYGAEQWTWGEFDSRVRRNANGQLAAGLRPGDRVAFLGKNHPACLETTFACALLGTVNAAINFRLTPDELTYVINDSRARILFAAPELVSTVEKLDLPLVERIVTDYEGFLAGDEQIDHEPEPDDCFLQLYTSGTTGYPKGALLTHRSMAAHSAQGAAAFGFHRDGNVQVAMPLFHVGGTCWAIGALWAGGTINIVPDVVPDQLLAQIVEERITHTFVVPAVIGFLLRVPGMAELDYGSLQGLAYGGSPIPVPLLREALKVFPDVLYQVYGMTEATGMFSMLTPEDHHVPELRKSAGRALSDVQMRVVDPLTGEPLPDDEPGEIQVRGAQLMAGYWQHPEETAATLVDGWLRTGDAGRAKDGYFFVEDRVKDMIISGGENIYPAEVERVLSEHPGVQEIAVIGVPDEKWGETVKAVVVGPVGADELIAYSREHLAGYKRPASVDIVEALPRNATGKILKRELRAPFWAGHERGVV
jgi:acyl-CoA synthetase (AMP-forming)/AMP-acid ligase II